MVEIELKVSKKYAKYIVPHLKEEHPTVRGHIEVESEKEKPRCKKVLNTVWSGKF